MSFADNLVYLRQHYGITQEGLAEQLSVSRQTVSKWKAGTNYPEMDKLLQLCDLFHTSLDDLMRGSVHVVKENDTERYDEHMNRFDLSIAAGVACILVGVGLNALLEAFGWPDNLQTVARGTPPTRSIGSGNATRRSSPSAWVSSSSTSSC